MSFLAPIATAIGDSDSDNDNDSMDVIGPTNSIHMTQES